MNVDGVVVCLKYIFRVVVFVVVLGDFGLKVFCVVVWWEVEGVGLRVRFFVDGFGVFF